VSFGLKGTTHAEGRGNVNCPVSNISNRTRETLPLDDILRRRQHASPSFTCQLHAYLFGRKREEIYRDRHDMNTNKAFSKDQAHYPRDCPPSPFTFTTSAGWTMSHPETPLAMPTAKFTEVGSTAAAAVLVAQTCG
jgi:hypothetical protein